MRPSKPRRGQRGSLIVELAIALPLLAFMAIMVAEGAGLVRAHQVLNNAAREGARLATLPENFAVLADIQSAVASYAANNGIALEPANVTVDQNLLVPTASGVSMRASRVTVTYSYPLEYLAALPLATVPRSVTLTGAAEFRNQY
jgi:Flp pilus assembly protein TadG